MGRSFELKKKVSGFVELKYRLLLEKIREKYRKSECSDLTESFLISWIPFFHTDSSGHRAKICLNPMKRVGNMGHTL